MEKEYFLELLQKQQAGKASKTELQFILSYYKLFDSEKAGNVSFSAEEMNNIKQQLRKEIGEQITLQESAQSKRSHALIWKIGLASAAAAAVLFFCFRLLSPNLGPAPEKQDFGLTLIKNSNHIISLPDGTTVTLSSGSKLNYDASFNRGKTREVLLDGQGFFDVKHDSSKPFIVHAGKVNVTVLGTAFNIKAFQEDRDITVTVKRGKVRVSNEKKTLGIITPQQQIVYNKNLQNAVQLLVKTNDYVQWKELDCLFDNLTLIEVAAQLEERFSVKIKVDKQLPESERFTATFPRNESLEEALKSICQFNDAIYKYDKETGTVYISKK